LALQEYNAQLDELGEKYDNIFDYDENGLRKINADRLAEAQWTALTEAQALQSAIASRRNSQEVERTQQNILSNRTVDSGHTHEENGVTYITGDYQGDAYKLEATVWNQIFDDIEAAFEAGNGIDIANILESNDITKDGNEAVYNYFVNLFDDYSKAINALQNDTDFGTFVKNSGATDIFD
jgi:hypothetical protein